MGGPQANRCHEKRCRCLHDLTQTRDIPIPHLSNAPASTTCPTTRTVAQLHDALGTLSNNKLSPIPLPPHAELAANGYNLDLCGFPHEVEEILPPADLIYQYQQKRAELNATIDKVLADITEHLKGTDA